MYWVSCIIATVHEQINEVIYILLTAEETIHSTDSRAPTSVHLREQNSNA